MSTFRYYQIGCHQFLRRAQALGIIGRAFKVKENAETAAVSFLSSERALSYLHADPSHLHWRTKCKWEHAYDSSGVPIRATTPGEIEVRVDRSKALVSGCDDLIELKAPILWREVQRTRTVETVVVGGEEYARSVDTSLVVCDWQEAFSAPGQPIMASLMLHIEEVEIEFFDEGRGD